MSATRHNSVHKPPCPHCKAPLAAADVDGHYCPRCDGAIVWGQWLGSLGEDGFKNSKDRGHWSIKHDYCGWRACQYNPDAKAHPFDSLPRHMDVGVLGKSRMLTICPLCLPNFKKHKARRRRQKRRVNRGC